MLLRWEVEARLRLGRGRVNGAYDNIDDLRVVPKKTLSVSEQGLVVSLLWEGKSVHVENSARALHLSRAAGSTPHLYARL